MEALCRTGAVSDSSEKASRAKRRTMAWKSRCQPYIAICSAPNVISNRDHGANPKRNLGRLKREVPQIQHWYPPGVRYSVRQCRITAHVGGNTKKDGALLGPGPLDLGRVHPARFFSLSRASPVPRVRLERLWGGWLLRYAVLPILPVALALEPVFVLLAVGRGGPSTC
jgi:hypothetical protein